MLSGCCADSTYSIYGIFKVLLGLSLDSEILQTLFSQLDHGWGEAISKRVSYLGLSHDFNQLNIKDQVLTR